jgi:hypothetical protein
MDRELDNLQTAQDIFDYVARKLMEQGGPSMNDHCVYRGKNGRKCAVGWLIDDSEYSSVMDESGPVESLAEEGLLPKRLAEHMRLLQSLQAAHDDASCLWDTWPGKMRMVASNHSLSDAVLAEAK